MKEKSRNMLPIQDGLLRREARPGLPYLRLDDSQGTVLSLPKRDEIPLHIDKGLVVEYYSRISDNSEILGHLPGP